MMLISSKKCVWERKYAIVIDSDISYRDELPGG